MIDAPLSKLLPHDPRQRAGRGLGNVRQLQPGRVELVSGSHGADDRNACGPGGEYDRQLSGHGVDCVHHVVVLGKIEFRDRFVRDKGLPGRQPDLRTDIQNARAGGVHLVLTDGASCGVDLAIQIAFADTVVVDQVKGAEAGANQSLRRIAADASDAEDRHTGGVQLFHARFSQQQGSPNQCFLHKNPSRSNLTAL